MANSRWLWLISLLIIGSALWMTIGSFKKLYVYFSLDKQTQLVNPEWSISAINDERYHPVANYHFTVDGKNYSGTSMLSHPYYRNPWGAEQGIQQVKKEKYLIWYSSRNPQINSLERSFPIKESVYTVIMWLLTAYFIGLIIYSTKRQSLKR